MVGENNIDVTFDQMLERSAMPVDAERVRQRQRDPSVRRVRQLRRLDERLLGFVAVEQISFQIGDLRAADRLGIDVVRAQHDADAKIRLHGAVGIGA